MEHISRFIDMRPDTKTSRKDRFDACDTHEIQPHICMCVFIYIYVHYVTDRLYIYMYTRTIIERSLEVKLRTIWTDEKAEVGGEEK